MIRDFSKEELVPAASNDTELTLGGFALFAMGGCLLLVCAVCFGAGYLMGHRSASESGSAVVVPATDLTAPASASASVAKPGAASQPPAQNAAQTSSQTQSSDTAVNSASNTATTAAVTDPTAAIKPAEESQVRPALQGESGATAASAFHVQPALKQAQGWMVQIAAVSHSEDAEVLVNALRKRGYTATARRDPADSLIHVQTGPFVNRNDANAMRQKLLNDGYNAIVQ